MVNSGPRTGTRRMLQHGGMGCEPSSSSLSTLKRSESKKLGDATNCRVSRKKAAGGGEGSGNPRFGSILSYLGLGFLGSSADKESACNAGDPGLITRSGRSLGAGIGYPLQYSWASLVAQIAKNLPTVLETWVEKIPWRREWQPTPVFLPGEYPWMEETGGLQSMGSQRVRHN